MSPINHRIRKTIETIVIFFLLLVVCVIPLLTHYVESFSHTVATGANIPVALTDTRTVGQVIYLQGKFTGLKVYVTINPAVPPQSQITFKVSQGETMEIIQVYAGDIKSGYLNVPVSPKKFVPGEITLTITSQGLSDMSWVQLWMCEDQSTGLPVTQIDGNNHSYPLSIMFSIQQSPPLFIYTTTLLALLLILCLITASLLAWKKHWLMAHNLVFMLLSFLLIVLVIGIRQPQTSFFGEPYSEAAYDFWQGQIEHGFWGSLMTLEANLYLSWLQRITTWIAVTIFPTKYVFVGMQLLMLAFIGVVSASFCTKSFRRFFGPLEQLVLSLLVGLYIIWQPMYMFHGLGYWGIFFILFFCIFRDMETIPRYQYLLGLGLSIVICLSKLFYVALLPVALFLLVIYLREKRPRLKTYWIALSAANVFHIIYVFLKTSEVMAVRQGLGSFEIPPLPRLFENIVYYQTQFFNTILTGKTYLNGLMANVILLCLLCLVIGTIAYFLLFTKKERPLCICLASCGLFSMGVIGVIILSGGGKTDMRAAVNWSVQFSAYNQHYMFIFIALTAMLFGVASFLKHYLLAHIIWENSTNCVVRFLPKIVPMGIILSLCMQFAPAPYDGWYTDITEFPTEWQRQCYVTERESYYLPINVSGAALISLCHNSYPIMFGYNDDGEWVQIPPGSAGLDDQKIYFSGSVQPLEAEGIISLTIRKGNDNFLTNYTMQAYDAVGQLICTVPQSNSDYRMWLTFLPEEPIYGAVEIRFVFTDSGTPAPVKDGMNIGVRRMLDYNQ